MEIYRYNKKIQNLEELKRDQYNAIEQPVIKKNTKTVLKDFIR
jgi:hypothetical protein